jgi:hypothetical protein
MVGQVDRQGLQGLLVTAIGSQQGGRLGRKPGLDRQALSQQVLAPDAME